LLDSGLSAMVAGIPRAEEGVRRLMELVDAVITIFDRTFRVHVEQSERAARIFKALADNFPYAVGISSPEGVVRYANATFRNMLRFDRSTGMHILDFLAPSTREMYLTKVAPSLLQNGAWSGRVRYRRGDGTEFNAHLSAFLVQDAQERQAARCAIIRDLTEEEEVEAEQLRLRERIIEVQKEALRELSTPLMPIAEGIVVMPLVGAIDADRAGQILDTLLRGIEERKADVAIIDITGVKVVDTQVAQALIEAATAASLLGAEVVLTGIRSAVAQSLVQLGADLGGVVTKGTLQAGVAHAMARRKTGG
jgi:rsbT co-antagonist protein RsbR